MCEREYIFPKTQKNDIDNTFENLLTKQSVVPVVAVAVSVNEVPSKTFLLLYGELGVPISGIGARRAGGLKRRRRAGSLTLGRDLTRVGQQDGVVPERVRVLAENVSRLTS